MWMRFIIYNRWDFTIWCGFYLRKYAAFLPLVNLPEERIKILYSKGEVLSRPSNVSELGFPVLFPRQWVDHLLSVSSGGNSCWGPAARTGLSSSWPIVKRAAKTGNICSVGLCECDCAGSSEHSVVWLTFELESKKMWAEQNFCVFIIVAWSKSESCLMHPNTYPVPKYASWAAGHCSTLMGTDLFWDGKSWTWYYIGMHTFMSSLFRSNF